MSESTNLLDGKLLITFTVQTVNWYSVADLLSINLLQCWKPWMESASSFDTIVSQLPPWVEAAKSNKCLDWWKQVKGVGWLVHETSTSKVKCLPREPHVMQKMKKEPRRLVGCKTPQKTVFQDPNRKFSIKLFSCERIYVDTHHDKHLVGRLIGFSAIRKCCLVGKATFG